MKGMKGLGPLVLTIDVPAMELTAPGDYLVVSVFDGESDNKQRTPIHKLPHTFQFAVERPAHPGTRLKFKIEKKSSGRKTGVVGKAYVKIEDLLKNGYSGNMKRNVLSRKGRTSSSSSSSSSSPKIMAILKFSYQFVHRPVEAPPELEEETVTANPAAATPPESSTPPMPAPPHQTAHVPNANFYGPPAGHGYQHLPHVPAPHHQTENGPNAPPANFYGPPAGYGYQHLSHISAPHHQMANVPPTYFYGPPAGYGYQDNATQYPPHIPAPQHQTTNVPYVPPAYFYGAPAGYRPAAPLPPHPAPPTYFYGPPASYGPAADIPGRVATGVAVNMITSVVNHMVDLVFNGGDFTMPGSDT